MPDDVRHAGLVEAVLREAGQRRIEDLLLTRIAFGLTDFGHGSYKN
jgi:hypothetical protein